MAEECPVRPPGSDVLVSVILPCYNGEPFLKECLESIARQAHRPLEISFWNDASSDQSAAVLEAAKPRLVDAGISIRTGATSADGPLGCGAAKNRAVLQSTGAFLCFQDADDVMLPERVAIQLEEVFRHPEWCLVGSNVTREPADAQPRHTSWLNGLTHEQLMLQRFKECTLAMPTWFCSRAVYDRAGGFDEAGPGTPEDLLFFYEHIRLGGVLAKVPQPLVLYRYHESQTSHGVAAERIWDLRVQAMETDLLDNLVSFSIWSAGRDGKRFFRSLSAANRAKVVCFLDIDKKKLDAGHYFDRDDRRHVPVKMWTQAARPELHPVIICIKSGLHEGFEDNLRSLPLEEGIHYWHFN